MRFTGVSKEPAFDRYGDLQTIKAEGNCFLWLERVVDLFYLHLRCYSNEHDIEVNLSQ